MLLKCILGAAVKTFELSCGHVDLLPVLLLLPFFFNVYEYFAFTYISALLVWPGALQGWKRESNALELQKVVICHESARSQF